MQEMGVGSLGQEDPPEEEMTTHSSLDWEFHGQRSWWATVHGVTEELDTTKRARTHTHTYTPTHTTHAIVHGVTEELDTTKRARTHSHTHTHTHTKPTLE